MAAGTPLIPVGTAAPSGGGGPIGWVEHEVGQFGKDLVNAAINSPAGLYHLGGGLIHDPGATLKALGGSVLQDFEHPLRHPGYTALDILGATGVAGGIAGRVAALGKVGTAAGERGALDALIYGLKVPPRVLKMDGQEVRGWTYSKNPIIRESQKLLDQLHERFPDGSLIPPWRSQASRVASASKSMTPVVRAKLRADAAAMLAKYQGAAPELHEAVLLTARGVMPADYLRYMKDRIYSGDLKGRTLREATAAIPRIEAAAKYVEPYLYKSPESGLEYTLPRLKTLYPELHQFRGDIEKFSRTREQALTESGYLSSESAMRRALGPKNVIEGHGLPENLTTLKKELRNLADNLRHPDGKRANELRGKIREAEGQLSLDALPNAGEATTAPGYVRLYRGVSGSKVENVPAWMKENHGRWFTTDASEATRYGKLHYVDVTEAVAAASKTTRPSGNEFLLPTKLAAKIKPVGGGLLKQSIQDPWLAKPIAEGGAGLFRIPEMIGPGARAVEGFQRAYKGGRPKTPGTLTHQYTGGILSHGGGRYNIAENTAESYIEAQRFLALKQFRGEIIDHARDTPEGIPEQWRLPIREDWFGGKMPEGFQFSEELANKPNLSLGESEAGGRWYEPLRQQLFGDRETPWRARLKQLTDSMKLTGEHVPEEKIPGIKWVDRRMLGGLDKQNPLWSAMESPYVRTALRTVDALNTAQKFALLYLKPAYIFPNMLGNIALTLVQQGFLAPVNLLKTAKIMLTGKGLDPQVVAAIKQLMGGGGIRSLGPGRGLGEFVKESSNAASEFYGKVVDDPFRFSAFLHEARGAGFKTPDELRDLVTNPEHKATLDEVAVRANDALINYERLSLGEQAFLRRLVFFYPWVKGSTRYALRLGAEHPVAAGLAGQGGKQGKEYVERTIGAVPSYVEGIFPVGHDKKTGLPTTVNPMSFSILGTSGDLLAQAMNLFTGPANPDLQAVANLSPVDAALVEILTGGKSGRFGGPNASPISKAMNDLYGGNPVATLLKALTTTTPPNRLYPDNNDWHAISRFAFLGGLTPRTYNPQRGNYTYWNETHSGR